MCVKSARVRFALGVHSQRLLSPIRQRGGGAEMLSFRAHNDLKSYSRLSRLFSRIAASLFQNPSDAFRHTRKCIGVVGERARAKIQNRPLWGLLIHLGASRHISNHLGTTSEPVEPERVAGLSAFCSTSYLNRWKWSPEPEVYC